MSMSNGEGSLSKGILAGLGTTLGVTVGILLAIFIIVIVLLFGLACCCCFAFSNYNSGTTTHTDLSYSGTSTPIPLGHSQNNAANIGQIVMINSVRYGTPYQAELTLEQVVRGDAAKNMMTDANMFNGVPSDPNKEYLLAKFNFNLIKWVPGKEFYLHSGGAYSTDFQVISNNELLAGFFSIIEPSPSFESTIYEGAMHNGWVALVCYKNDPSPVIIYEKSTGGSGGIWFKTA